MATSAQEPQPWDMLSPISSLGTQISQVNVPPAATMWAQPGMAVSVRVFTRASPGRRRAEPAAAPDHGRG